MPVFKGKCTQCFTFGEGEETFRNFSRTKIRPYLLDIDSDPAGTPKGEYGEIATMGNIELDAFSKCRTLQLGTPILRIGEMELFWLAIHVSPKQPSQSTTRHDELV